MRSGAKMCSAIVRGATRPSLANTRVGLRLPASWAAPRAASKATTAIRPPCRPVAKRASFGRRKICKRSLPTRAALATEPTPRPTTATSDVVARGAHALNPRGEFYTPENIQERLALRNYLDELRGAGERTGGPAALDNTDRKRFADQLDRFLARLKRPG